MKSELFHQKVLGSDLSGSEQQVASLDCTKPSHAESDQRAGNMRIPPERAKAQHSAASVLPVGLALVLACTKHVPPMNAAKFLQAASEDSSRKGKEATLASFIVSASPVEDLVQSQELATRHRNLHPGSAAHTGLRKRVLSFLHTSARK